MNKAVFLDRDGTIIIDKVYLNDPAGVEYLPKVFEALQRLRDLGFVFCIATNQSGIARGIVDPSKMDAIHDRISNDFAKHGVFFRGFYYSPYSTTSNHLRRKPNPGMLLDGARDHRIDLKYSWMIGDRITDVIAGHKAGCRSILLEGVETPSENSSFIFENALVKPEAFVKDLWQASQCIERSIEPLSRST